MVEKTIDDRFMECVRRALQSMQASGMKGTYVWGRQIVDLEKGLHFSEAAFRDALFQEMMRVKQIGEQIGCEASYPDPDDKRHIDIAYDCVDESKPLFRKPVEIKLWHADGNGLKSTEAVRDDAKKLQTYSRNSFEIQPAVLVVASSDGNLSACLKSLTSGPKLWETEPQKAQRIYTGCEHCSSNQLCAVLLRVSPMR